MIGTNEIIGPMVHSWTSKKFMIKRVVCDWHIFCVGIHNEIIGPMVHSGASKEFMIKRVVCDWHK